MSKKPRGDRSHIPAEEEAALFKEAMQGVRPLDDDSAAIRKPAPKPMPVQSRRDEIAVLDDMARANPFDYELEYGDEAVFQRPEIPRTMMRKLRRGQIAVQSEIDLHGHNIAEAKAALSEFLNAARDCGWRCVRVIHGKGHRSPGKTPVLKPKVARWLSQRDDVAAFVSARPVDGGTGALYVLLR